LLGESFSHYRILEKLGEGGMGVVYLAEDTLLGRRVAIKFPRASGQHSQRLLSEARTASSLTHPAIAAIHDYGMHEDHPYVVMELVEGENLSDLIARGPLPPRRAIEIAAAVTGAVAEAHGHGIVHRDIKPANIRLDRRGAVKVLDFGIATHAEEARAAVAGPAHLSVTQTVDGTLSGTPRYMSPEQARGERAGTRSDLFSVGVILWECLTGKPAFSGRTPMDVLAQVLQVDPPAPSTVNPGVPRVLDRIALKALAKDPEARYQTAEALAEDLESARLTSVESRAAHPAIARWKGRRLWLAAAACAAVVAAAGIVWVLRGGGHAPTPQALRWYQEGANAIRDGTYYKAAKALERSVALDPGFALAHARLADAADEMDDVSRAHEEMLKAVAPGSTRSRLSSRDDLEIEAIRRTLTHDPAGAAAVYRQLLSRVPDSARAGVYLDLGRVSEKAGQPKEARAAYREAARLSPQFAAAFLRLGVLDRRAQRFSDAEADFAQAESLYRSLSNAEGLTEVLYQRGVMANKRGDTGQAASILERTLQMARDAGNVQQQVQALLELSSVKSQQGDTAGAAREASDATALTRSSGMDALTAGALIDQGNAHFLHGDLQQAHECYMQSVESARRFHSQRTEARALLSLGSLSIQQSDLVHGVNYVEQALRFYDQGGDTKEKSVALVLLGRARRDEGDYAGALRAFEQQLALAAKTGDQAQLGNAREGLATVFEYQERYPEALAAYQQAQTASQARGDELGAGYGLASEASVLADLGRYPEAETALGQAAAIAGRTGGYEALARLVEQYRARIALSQRRFAAAAAGARKLLAVSAQLGTSDRIDVNRLACAAELPLGARRAALALCQAALSQAQASGVPRLVSAASLSLAEAQIENGDAAAARDTAMSVRSGFAQAGQQESEARALLIAARAARASHDTAGARSLAAEAAQSFEALVHSWSPEDRASYQARPDVRSWLNQISEIR
jgi:tetratricopeptide (TPR) repeat protein